jgi:hypothetical protein
MERYEVDELLKLTPEEQIEQDKFVNGIKTKMKIFGFLYKNFIGLSILSLISMNIIGIYLLSFLKSSTEDTNSFFDQPHFTTAEGIISYTGKMNHFLPIFLLKLLSILKG